MENPIGGIVGAFVFLMGSVWIWRRSTVARRLLADHVVSKRYHLVDAEFRFIRSGPFTFGPGPRGLSLVYRLKAADANGKERFGWALVGHWLFGLTRRTVTLQWDKDQSSSAVTPTGR